MGVQNGDCQDGRLRSRPVAVETSLVFPGPPSYQGPPREVKPYGMWSSGFQRLTGAMLEPLVVTVIRQAKRDLGQRDEPGKHTHRDRSKGGVKSSHGVLAPHAKNRNKIVPARAPPQTELDFEY